MEPADIDWKKVVSVYVCDDALENFNAPMWTDLSRPDPALDDVAWFCRPDCRHPRTAEDFQRSTPSPKAKLMRSSSERLPRLGERNTSSIQRDGNLKRRGGIPSAISSASPRESPKGKPSPKKFCEDAENRNPNLAAKPPPGRANESKAAKEAVKSSADKRGENGESKKAQQPAPPVARLKSTLSARNLFAGKDLLSQISEFCQELKKMALRKERGSSAREEEKVGILGKEEEVVEENGNLDSKRKDLPGKKVGRLAVRVGTEGEKNKKVGDANPSVLREAVRSCPPTPQRFPSPSTHRLRSTKATNGSPLNKPPKSSAQEKKGILQELDQSRDERRALVSKDEEENRASVSPNTEGNSVDVFWFLKPCTYLIN